jgi:LytS/YehU family sensor histidine kinase
MNKNDSDLANTYLSDFATLIRMTMENTQKAFIPINEEIERIRLYLSLEELRFGEGLKHAIYIDSGLDTALSIPNMILQPYIENAIWHGIMPNSGNGKILVSFLKQSENEIKITIEDNGVGIINGNRKKKASDKRQFGMRLTEERLNLLRELLHQVYSVTVRELIDENHQTTGTIVEIILPSHPNEKEMELIQEALNA